MLDSHALAALVAACAPLVASDTALALIRVESAGNPHAIGVVGNQLVRQPRTRAEAVATAMALDAAGWDYSVGLGQINRRNFHRLGLTVDTAFDPCTNLQAMQTILGDCFGRAVHKKTETSSRTVQFSLRQAFSCYYSGNFVTGFQRDLPGQASYVDRILTARVSTIRPPSGAPPP